MRMPTVSYLLSRLSLHRGQRYAHRATRDILRLAHHGHCHRRRTHVFFGCLYGALEQAFHWKRGEISQASLCAWVAFGLGSFLFGLLSDRYGTRVVVLTGGLMLGCGMLALSRMHALWHLYLFYGLLVGGGTGAFMVPLTSTIMCWFMHKRALMVVLTNCGTGIGGTLLAPLTRYLVLSFDWRDVFFIYGVLVWAVVLPLTVFIRNRPEDIGLQPYGGTLAAISSLALWLRPPLQVRPVMLGIRVMGTP
jgi:sugar phosphate permease